MDIKLEEDTIQIYGIQYSLALFRDLAFAPVGTVFRICKREDGVVYLQKIAVSEDDHARIG